MIKKIILVIFGLYIILLVGFYFFQEKIIFQSKKLNRNFTYTVQKKFEEVNLTASDNSNINAIHFKVDKPKGVILYFHGNKGNLQRWATMVLPLTNYGYDLFIIDYRGYGKSTGERSEPALYADAQLAYDYLKKDHDEAKIVIYGRSLGCTFATYVAAENKPKQLILEAPFYNLASVSKSKFPLFPYSNLLKYQFKTNTFISKVTSSIAIFHGDKDRLIPLESGKKLFEAADHNIIEFLEVKNGTHHNLSKSDIYKEKLKTLLN